MKTNSRQQSFLKMQSKSKLIHGGEHRKKRYGRLARPLSTKSAHHIVFKIYKENLVNRSFRHPKNFKTVQRLLKRYSQMFFIKIEQISYQHDHIHILARSGRRSHFHHFFRVFAGQVAQTMKVTGTPKKRGNSWACGTSVIQGGGSVGERGADVSGSSGQISTGRLWKGRPFTRIIVGWFAMLTIRNYIQLNEKEVTGIITYRKERLRGLTMRDWQLLWS